MDARRKAVQTSIRQISTEELNSLVTEILFEDPAHPWCEIFRQFIKDNASAVFYQAEGTYSRLNLPGLNNHKRTTMSPQRDRPLNDAECDRMDAGCN